MGFRAAARLDISFQLDHRVVWFTVLVSVASAMLFGLAPALRSTRTDLVPALKAGPADQGGKRPLGRNVLVIGQVAGSLVLLVAATQLFRGFAYVLDHNPGFRTDHLIMMTFDPALVRYTPMQTEQFYRKLTERAHAVPGVKSAALTFSIPAGTNQQAETVIPEGYRFPRGKESISVIANTVDNDYFQTFGVKILRGRGFLTSDRADSPRVAVVNEVFARHYLGENPIGKRFRLDNKHGTWIEVVAVAAASKVFSIVEPPAGFLYLPLSQHPQSRMTLLAASYGDPAVLAKPLREMVRSLDPDVPIFGVRTMSDFFEQRSVKVLHMIDGIVGLASLLGLILAVVGLYAVVAYQVVRRTREIGIRMAIGADRGDVATLVLKQAGAMGLTGVCIGIALSLAGGRALTALFEVPSFDPVLFVLVAIGLLLTTVLAAAIPARKAARVDPMIALRQD